MTALTEKEQVFVQKLRSLSPEAAEKILNWATQLADLAKGRVVDWSDTWSKQDFEDATASSLRNFEERESKAT